MDPTGESLVGLGVQLDITIGSYECGIEIIVYWDETVCNGGGPVVAIYVYEGASVSTSDILKNPDCTRLIEQLVLALATNAGKDYDTLALMELQSMLFDTSISGSVVGIWGYDNFISTEDYEGPFTSYSGNIKHFKVTWSHCDTCWAIAVGGTTDSGAAFGFGQTYYTQIYSSIRSRTPRGNTYASRSNNYFNCVDFC
jgi:hypothetical protein